MTAEPIDGKAFAAALREKIAAGVAEVKAQHNITPGLAVILVGDDPASQVYVRNKGKACAEVGMQSFETILPTSITQDELLAHVARYNADANVHGILVQLPLPKHLDTNLIVNTIHPAKDVDGFTITNVGKMTVGHRDGLVPCTPLGCLMLIKSVMSDLSGARALVIGRSETVGKPMASLLLKENCTVTIAHSKTRNIAEEVKVAGADILVAAIGKPEFVRGDWVKPGATVIDVGINRIEHEGKTKLVGDVDFAGASEHAKFITPVPGGVGPMTIACLLRNTLQAACASRGVAFPLA